MTKQRHDEEPTAGKMVMPVLAVGGLLVAGLVAWALTRTVEPAPSAPTATFAESPATTTFTPTDTTTLGNPSPITSAPITTSTNAPRVITEQNSGTEEEKAAVKRIAVEDLRAKHNRGEVTVIDVRGATDYANGHVPGALNIPLASIEAQLDRIPKGKPVITYCT
jgi:hypothetical protein